MSVSYISDGSIKWADMGEVYIEFDLAMTSIPYPRAEAFADQLKTDFQMLPMAEPSMSIF